MHAVDELTAQLAILGVCETWARGDSDPITGALDGSSAAPPGGQLHTGHGAESGNHDGLRGMYEPMSEEEDEIEVLDKLHKLAGIKALTTGDMNARHSAGDTRCNARGRRLVRWARKNGWCLTGSKKPTFESPREAGTPDQFMTKGLNTTDATTRTVMAGSGSDHLPVEHEVIIHNKEEEPVSKRHIARKQRKNPRILLKARQQYAQELPDFLVTVREANGAAAVEEAYKCFREALLQPWESARKRKPNRFEPWCNDTLESMSKL